MADPDAALATLREAVNTVAAELAMCSEPVPPNAPLSRVVSGFRALDAAATSGSLPDVWANWQRYHQCPRGNDAETFPRDARRQLDAAGAPPPLARRMPGATIARR